MNIYFDNAATTPIRKEVITTISDVMEDCFGNPSSTHSYWRKAKAYVEIDIHSRLSLIRIQMILKYW